MPTSTIYALATPPGRSALAVIRLSGVNALKVVQNLTGLTPAPRHATLMTLRDEDDILDRALVTYFKGPASYTGEDVVEISLHGGRAVVAGVMNALEKMDGLRAAEPGEFTKRAFLNHKLDLTAAEAVADLIDAETMLQRRQAIGQLGGKLRDLYDAWRDDLIKSCAYVEAHLDFPDEDLPTGLIDHIRPVVTKLQHDIGQHLDDGKRGEILRDGLNVVILGAPNAGKSSLLNALARRDAAIVSPLAGTTRDVLDVHLDLNGLPVTLTDTAGLHDNVHDDGHASIEREGMKRARARASTADLKIILFDAGAPPAPDMMALVDDHTLLVANKIDTAPVPKLAGHDVIAISALHGQGLDDLVNILTARLEKMIGSVEGASITRARHRTALQSCTQHLHSALAQSQPELIAEDLRAAVNDLGRITGRVDVEDLLDVIFRDFCIGK
jgi:tRNA modification GTPase